MPKFITMPPSTCLRTIVHQSFEGAFRPRVARSLLASQTSCFSTSPALYANPSPKKKTTSAAPKRGTKTLNVKRGRTQPGGDTGKRPAPGERKAYRKRIVLSNDNALEVSSLEDLDQATVLDRSNQGEMRGLPDPVIDALRAIEAFKPTQGWRFFRRPATLMRSETIKLADLMKDAENGTAGQKKTVRRVVSGDRLSGKSALLLQGLAMASMKEWVIINIPEGMYAMC